MNPFVPVHEGVDCDQCKTRPIRGVRYKCGDCDNYDVCATCFPYTNHNASHTFLLVKQPRKFSFGPPLAQPEVKSQRFCFATDTPSSFPFGGGGGGETKTPNFSFPPKNNNSPQTFPFTPPQRDMQVDPTKYPGFSFGKFSDNPFGLY